jgi:hypothetical protein
MTTGCTLTGTPFPTTGTCSETARVVNGTSTASDETTYTVPNTSVDSVGDYTLSKDIFTATIAVIIDASGNQSLRTASGTSGLLTPTPAPTTSSGASGSKATSSSTKGSGSTSATPNVAKITTAPAWMLVAGAVAGAAVVI